MIDISTHKQALTHVFWIGGSPCSGKSSIAEALVKTYGWTSYHCDAAFYQHAKIITPEDQPTFFATMRLYSEDLWMRPAEQQAAGELAIYREEFPMILADLLALPSTRPILVEGAALLPECVAPLLTDPRKAIWVTPSPAFQLEHYRQREWAREVVSSCSNPEQAFQNWMERDIQFAAFVRQTAEQCCLRSLVVDGQISLEANIELVKEYFEQ